ncbi:MAG: ABC transporter ATP-binding protein [Peptostreptococcaceae bacterium]
MKKKIIEFKDFDFKYKSQSKETLKNINLSIYEGEKVLIVGPSGSGKSTLSSCLNGIGIFYHKAQISGTLNLDGEDISKKGIFDMSKKVGTVLQDPDSQFIGLTVGEDIAFKLENNCVEFEKMKEIVSSSAKKVNIFDEINTSPYKLSGGQKQRVGLAGVIVDDVKILLFDEPLASLDPLTGKTAMELIDEIQKNQNKTIIIIEHRIEDVLHANVDRIVVVNNGEIVADDTPENILRSDILETYGLREPLDVTALKYAGCDFSEKLKEDNYKEKVRDWFDKAKNNSEKIKENTVLEFNDVTFGYGPEKTILKNMNFKINKGDMVAIAGKNGAGKSTLSKLICGFYKPQSGQILFEGNDLVNKSIKARAEKIGFVMQNPNQMISQTMIFDEVAFGLKVRGVSEKEIEERVNETLKICGLYGYRKWPINSLSYGQRKRVTIASILVLNPEIIILDEPTAGQDFKHYTEIMEFLRSLNKKGVTIIMVTHDMHLMLEYTNNVIVVVDGQNIKSDTPANVLTNEEVILQANLKKTSLQELAEECKILDTTSFVNKFIEHDRTVRQN